MNTVDILKAARGEVLKGWCKRSLEDKDGNVCVNGAINRVADGSAHPEQFSAVGQEAWSLLRRHLPSGYMLLCEYNNAEATTQQDILNLFDKTLADLGGLA